MPDESQPPSEPDPPCEPTRMASSDHPSGDTWRLEQTPTRTGGSFPPVSLGGASRPAEVIGDFEVVGKLGQGGMGTVYRARQRSLNRLVALKILPAKLEADAEYVARFQREARVVGNKITVKLDGVEAGFVEDDSIHEGGATIEGDADAGEIFHVRGVQYLDLSAPAKTGSDGPR